MNISIKNSDDKATAIIKMMFKEDDYYPEVEKTLRSLRQRVEIDGFRKGKVPYELIRSKYEVPAILESVEKIVDRELPAYLMNNNIEIIGTALPNVSEQKTIDWKKEREFELLFDVALRPKINISLSKQDVLSHYKVTVTDEMVENEIKMGLERYGTSEPSETITPKARLVGTLVELNDKGETKENGLKVENTSFYPIYFRSEEQKAKFENSKVGDSITFNPYEALGGSESELEFILKIDRLDVVRYKGDFRFTINEIYSFVPAPMDKRFFSQMLEGNDTIEDEAAFKAELLKLLNKRYENASNEILAGMVRKLLIEKAGEMPISIDFVKRLAKSQNEKLTDEQADKHIPQQIDTIKWSIVKDYLQKENDVKIDEKDILEEAKKRISMYFKMYGLPITSDEALEKRATEMLKGGQFNNELHDAVLDKWLSMWALDQVTIEEKEVSLEQFYAETASLGNLV